MTRGSDARIGTRAAGPPIAVGVDVSCSQCWAARLRRTPRLAFSAFTEGERRWCRGDPVRHTVAWSVKEAVVKLSGQGFDPIGWHGVEVCDGSDGGLAVSLGVDARLAVHERLAVQTCPGSGCSACSLTVRTRRDSRLVSAVALAGPGHAVVAAVGFQASRTTRATVGREAAHAAARKAAAELGLVAFRVRSGSGAPAAHAQDRSVAVSLAHDCGRATSAVAVPASQENGGYESDQLSALLTFSECDTLIDQFIPATLKEGVVAWRQHTVRWLP